MKFEVYNKDCGFLTGLESSQAGNDLFELCSISKELMSKSNGQLTIKFEQPIIDIQGYWNPDMYRPRMTLAWKIEFSCAAHCNFPYICFFNQAHQNRMTIGTSNLLDDALISAEMNQQTGKYDIEIKVSINPSTDKFEIFIDRSERPWTEVMQDYRNFVLPDIPSFPDAAWRPVFCTWYAVHAELSTHWLDEQSTTAAAMGFGTFIVDDGWCFDTMKRVSPKTITTWYDEVGEWKLSENKLPNFKGHIKRTQKLGLKYLLWVSPFMIGMKSRFMAETDCGYLTDENEGYRVFDPCNFFASEHSICNLIRIVKEFDLDGLKIDFVDVVPQNLHYPRGRAVYDYMTKLIESLREFNEDALFEFRQKYSTPVMLSLGTQFRANDVPFDFIENIHRIALIRICLGDKVPVHADPAYWAKDELQVHISKHMICAIAGVPMLSMDLNELSVDTHQIIENWLAFYTTHLNVFRNGHWQINYNKEYLDTITVEYQTEKIVFVCDRYHPDLAKVFKGNVYLLNLTENEVTQVDCQSFGFKGEALERGRIIPGGYGILSV